MATSHLLSLLLLSLFLTGVVGEDGVSNAVAAEGAAAPTQMLRGSAQDTAPHALPSTAVESEVNSETPSSADALTAVGEVVSEATASGAPAADTAPSRAVGEVESEATASTESVAEETPPAPETPTTAEVPIDNATNASGSDLVPMPEKTAGGAPEVAGAADEPAGGTPLKDSNASVASRNDTVRTFVGDCLCLFDIDRTLTGKQSVGPPTCPSNSVQHGVYDNAYGNGDLTLSSLGRNLRSTGCGRCKLGVVSHGTAGGNSMKGMIYGLLQGSGYIPNHWSYPGSIHSPLVLGCSYKPACVRGVVDWYNRHGASIQDSQVYFFDDKGSNVRSFYGSEFNARQVSCASRDWGLGGSVGFCGANPWEVSLRQGVHTC